MAINFVLNPYYSAAGVLVGVLVGITGVGGGSLMTPLLVLLFGFSPQAAVGTDLLFASITKSVGSVMHGKFGTVDWRIVGRLASGSVPAAIVTVAALHRLGKPPEAIGHVITMTLGVMLIVTAVTLLFRTRIIAAATRFAREGEPKHPTAATVALGALLGVLVSMTSVGAGAIGVTILIILYPRLPVARVVGSDIAHAVPLTLVGGIGHWMIGTVDFVVLGNLLIGSIPGIILGSAIGSRASDRLLQPVLAIVLVIVGTRLLF